MYVLRDPSEDRSPVVPSKYLPRVSPVDYRSRLIRNDPDPFIARYGRIRVNTHHPLLDGDKAPRKLRRRVRLPPSTPNCLPMDHHSKVHRGLFT